MKAVINFYNTNFTTIPLPMINDNKNDYYDLISKIVIM